MSLKGPPSFLVGVFEENPDSYSGCFFSSVQRDRSTFCALMHIYQLLPYVLSTSFSTHSKTLTWDKKPFQSRRVHFFRHYETFLLFSALWDCSKFDFFSEFFLLFPINIWYFATEWMFKKSQRVPPFTFFGTMRLTGNFKKISKKNWKIFFSQFLVFWELLLSPVVEKVVFASFWALDMAPTWAVPGLFDILQY